MRRCEKRTTTRWVVVLFWQRRKDSNLGNDGVRVRCLTAWRRRNIYNAIHYITHFRVCQGDFEKKLYFSKKIFFSKKGLTKQSFCDIIVEYEIMRP